MAHHSPLIAEDIEGYLRAHEAKDLLRFITCGSVDDGKSTLIGRLLYESKMIFDDHLAALTADSRKFGTTGEMPDLALLVDGLAAEREQGITIDVAYRFFSTDRRRFIVADTPGHEQYTRNMATGASTADLAIVIVDARKGLQPQTKRHSFIVSMMGIRHVVLAVNKMDLVNYDAMTFRAIERDYAALAKDMGIETVTAIPVSALQGDNIVSTSQKMQWYKGFCLMEHLESVEIATQNPRLPFRMPVQWVNRPNADFRGYAGRIAAGVISPGEAVRIMPSGKQSRVARVVTADGDLGMALPGQSVTLTLADEIDISRGDVIVAAKSPCEAADQFEAQVIWFSEKPLVTGRQYILRSAASTAFCTPVRLKHKLNVNTLERLPARALSMNEIGVCEIALDRPIAFEAYAQNRELGSFIIVDRMTNETVAAGMINHALRRATNVHMHATTITPAARADAKGQTPCVLWLTGLSGAGKSTIANLVEQKLTRMGHHTMLLDGDNIRHGLNKDLGFTEHDRAENIRRIAEVAKLMTEAGIITIVSFISPFAADRQTARGLIGTERFIEIFVDAPLEIAEARDVKGLYKRARAGEIPNFTGIDSPYEKPEQADLCLDTVKNSAENLADEIIALLSRKDFIANGI